ncbi:MAG TPA: Lrp/AsnC family transcriptional regulator [Ferruginibacter sp.]|nr:Lrp/AsnC family transcriptional regulator [Ferruginibacter sp.]
MQAIDAIDKKILSRLQKNNLISAAELGKSFNLSTSAVQRRINRLREENIIEADISIVSQAVVSKAVTCIVEISLQLGNMQIVEEFKTMLCNCNEVMQSFYVAGVYDFIVIISVEDMSTYDTFARTYFMDNAHVKQFCTHVVLQKTKLDYSVAV